MLHSKLQQWTTCDRCGVVIDNSKLFTVPWKHRFEVNASRIDYEKHGCFIPDSLIPMPENNTVEIYGIIGNKPNFQTLHLCNNCGKEFKRFMKNEH